MKSFDESYESFGDFTLLKFRRSKDKQAFRTSAVKAQSGSAQEELSQAGLFKKRERNKVYSLSEICRLKPQENKETLIITDYEELASEPAVHKFCAYDPFKKLKSESDNLQKKKKGKPTPHYAGINYGSISEAALGILLEELIPDFSVKEGKTFQLPLGGGRTVDFLINNVLVEFHFPRFFLRSNDLGDFASVKERRDFHKALKRVGRSKHQKKKLLEDTHDKLIRNYSLKRRKQIDMSVYGPHTELIVASSAQEFYWKVICRFAGVDKISEQQFIDKFNYCCKSVIKSSKQAWKKAA